MNAKDILTNEVKADIAVRATLARDSREIDYGVVMAAAEAAVEITLAAVGRS
jgi:hypothetical protein